MLTFEHNWLIEMWLAQAGFASLGVTIRLHYFNLALLGTGGGCLSSLSLSLFKHPTALVTRGNDAAQEAVKLHFA